MLTMVIIFALMPILVFIELTLHRWLFINAAEKHDAEWELYQQRWD